MAFPIDMVIVGGCGHVGLPLGLAFANVGKTVALLDRNADACALVNEGVMPFEEPDTEPTLRKVLATNTLFATTDPAVVAQAEHVVVIVGTPVDEHLNPTLHILPRAIDEIGAHLRHGQLLILRSTVYPGVTALVERLVRDRGIDIDVAFCPERLAEGHAMEELTTLPQLVAARSDATLVRAAKLFHELGVETVPMAPEEAELAKLFTNSWRYIKFAVANQFYMIANDAGLDFETIRTAMTHEYPRARDLPRAGFAAGPCLFKDTMQLAAFNNHAFTLGHSALMINEGLPLYLVAQMEREHSLADATVGILGMAFKAESDDIRASLSYKLKRILRFKAREVLTTDPYVTLDTELQPLEDVLTRADLLIVGAPHAQYRSLQPTQPVVDVWNCVGSGAPAALR
ncbi:MAG: nucleotide sugar dehydrogenase [Acidimicrobiia bacterium]